MSAPDGWCDPARPPPDDEDCAVLLRRAVHGRRVFPATHDARPHYGWSVSVESACFSIGCPVEEHRFDWERLVVGWLPLPDERGVVKKEARGG